MSIQFQVRDFMYPLSILRLRALFERSQWWSSDDLLEYQRQMLRRTVACAYHEVPYYRDLFRRLHLTPDDIQTIEDLRKLPLLSKATVRSEFRRLHAASAHHHHARTYQTSGTSGEPVRFLIDKPANVLEFVYYWRSWSWAGYQLGARFAELTSHYFLKDDQLAKQPWRYQRGLRRLLLNSLALSANSADEFARAIRRYRPAFLKGLASALYFFAWFAKERGVTDLALQAVFSTGELLLASQRRLIEDVFNAKVYDSYGHMERTVAISECPSGGFHINPEYGILEMVERTPLPTAVAQGSEQLVTARVVGTSLHNRSMPLLRYEVGDVVEAEELAGPCPCGRAMPRVRRIVGRQEDVITTTDGRVIPSMFILFNQVPGIALGQAVQDAPDRLVVRIVRSLDYTAQSESELYRYLKRFLGRSMQIDVEYVSAEALRPARAGKFRTIISRVPLAAETMSRESQTHQVATGA